MDIGQKNLTFHIYVEQPGKFCCDNGHCIDSEFRYGIKTIYSKGCSKKNGEWWLGKQKRPDLKFWT